jgi:pimeloyl-ACP methyl ester carboxylesterase
MWASQIDAFAERYRVLTLDLRGHGQSRPANPYSFEGVVEDCFALLDHLHVERAVVVGLSMGGNVAQEMAFERPERIAAMVCLDCTCNTLVPWADRLLVPVYRAAFGPMMALYPTNALLDQIAKGSSLSQAGQRYLHEASAQLSKAELTKVMKTLLATLHHEPDYRATTPELIMHGSGDQLGNIRKIMPKWHRRDPTSEFVVIPDASHCANVDNPRFVNQTVMDWLDRVT